MGAKKILESSAQVSGLLVSSRDYFTEMVEDGFAKKKLAALPLAKNYLVNLLEHYLPAQNLFESELTESGARRPQTLAEMYLTAGEASRSERFDLLKKMADKSLYISGFFGESLTRKVVDVDYYAGMGGAAYHQLSESSHEPEQATVFRMFANRFLDFVDVLTYISQKSLVHSNSNLISLFEHYSKTGSEIARDRLLELGVIIQSAETIKKGHQD